MGRLELCSHFICSLSLPPPPPDLHVVYMLIFNIILSYKRLSHRNDKYKRYKYDNSNVQYFPAAKKAANAKGPKQPKGGQELSQNPPIPKYYS